MRSCQGEMLAAQLASVEKALGTPAASMHSSRVPTEATWGKAKDVEKRSAWMAKCLSTTVGEENMMKTAADQPNSECNRTTGQIHLLNHGSPGPYIHFEGPRRGYATERHLEVLENRLILGRPIVASPLRIRETTQETCSPELNVLFSVNSQKVCIAPGLF